MLATLLFAIKANLAAADRIVRIPFEYASDQGSILVRGSVDQKPVLLILDTTSARTVLQAGIFNGNHSDLPSVRGSAPEPTFIRDMVGREVSLELGGVKFENQRIFEGDLSRFLSGYKQKIDGVLGLDFLKEFSQFTINVKQKTISLVSDNVPASQPLGNLTFERGQGHYFLNGVELPRIATDSIDLSTADQSCHVRATFLKTVLLANGKSVDPNDSSTIERWSENIPKVAQILKQHDRIGSLKPIMYALIKAKDRDHIQFREQLTLLWSADPAEAKNIGHSGMGPLMQFSNPIVDIQYRTPAGWSEKFMSKVFLQILYVHNGIHPIVLGGFVITSQSTGDYEFYEVPMSLLRTIVQEEAK